MDSRCFWLKRQISFLLSATAYTMAKKGKPIKAKPNLPFNTQSVSYKILGRKSFNILHFL